ncbi:MULTISPECIES: hypothetical protein [Pasteurellaceae]|uniref:Hemagglutinin n=1 Tax=Pasteurella atlantica TaxID=2827233 RepID=A0AAW8CG56_9PAST|nr:hypothetical protein [Pasteurella atlantica]MBR0573021.1 hypothetical protein [Pasteurella atlantica]MDP8038852.1 hypothetical protein [Pasteurella atlantica]MDP8041039.1 hypothetical protein [Pasteurella atlantica]MDP8043175.1 hypothetical protein [Pasteurella atlantica]MDP8045261.1 hypothetical protein [Pasteurella atlantica]
MGEIFGRAVISVDNMSQFFKHTDFGKLVGSISKQTAKMYQGQSVYEAKKKIGEFIKKGDQFYLDNKHKDHLEVFDKRGNFKHVLNLNGTRNFKKTEIARKEKRILR